jgi:hypothetical protein
MVKMALSGMLSSAVWQKLSNISEVLTASIIRALGRSIYSILHRAASQRQPSLLVALTTWNLIFYGTVPQ